MTTFKITAKHAGERLDKFLTEKIGQTRSQLQKLIKAGGVEINGKKAKVHQFLNEKDVVKTGVPIMTPEQTPAVAEHKSETSKLKPEIMEKNKNFLIVAKPAGMLVHPTAKGETNTLINLLIKKFPRLAKIGDAESIVRGNREFRPGIVHRLDRDVSGVMVIPRSQEMFDHLKRQFKLRRVHKIYIALVHGIPPAEKGIIDFEISRGKNSGRMAAHPEGSGKGKPSATEYEVLQNFGKFSLLKLRPLTGRTNQIRVHLFAFGHPIVGDKLYLQKSVKSSPELDRIFLHAETLEFEDLDGATKFYELPLPDELQNLLDQLEK